MKKLLFLFLLSSAVLETTAQITFERSFTTKGSGFDPTTAVLSSTDSVLPIQENIGLDILQTSDLGYVTLGSIWDFSNDFNIQLIKYDKYGEILWNRTFIGASQDFGRSVQRTPDGGYIFTGSTSSYGAGGSDVQLIKTDSLGNQLWSKTFGGAGHDYGSSVCVTSDSCFMVIGSTNSMGSGNMDVYVLKVDGNGNMIWSGTYGGTQEDKGAAVHTTADGGCILVGTTKSFGAGDEDAYVVKLNASGATDWAHAYGGTDKETAKNVLPSADGGYIIGGTTLSFGAGERDMYLIKTDALGVIQWSNYYGGALSEEMASLALTDDGGYVLCGATNTYGAGQSDVCIIKTDNAGNSVWGRTYGGSGNDGSYAVCTTQDLSFAITGYKENLFGVEEWYIVKTNQSGNTSCVADGFSCVYGNVVFTMASGVNLIANVSLENTGIVDSDSLENVSMNLLCSNFPITMSVVSTPVSASGASSGRDTPPAFGARSVDELAARSVANVFPNPGTGEFHITGLQMNDRLEVYDAAGVLLIRNEDHYETGMIDLTGKAKGFYFYKIYYSSGGFEQGKIVLN